MSTLPTRIAKQIAGQCCYSGCTDKALDGSDYCDPHDAHERGRDANKKRRRRQRLAQAGLCVAGCGRKVPRKRKPDGSVMQRRCNGCKKVLRDARVPDDAGSVPGASSEPDRITHEVEGDGYARKRFHGQQRRGQQKRWQLDLQDLDDAIDRLQRTKRGVILAREAEEAGVPRVQRDEIRFEAMSHAAHAGRFVDDVLERNGYDDGEMIETIAKARA